MLVMGTIDTSFGTGHPRFLFFLMYHVCRLIVGLGSLYIRPQLLREAQVCM